MKIFIATRFGHRLRLDFREFVDELFEDGHIVVSSWHEREGDDADLDVAAWDNIHDLESADAFIQWSVDADGGAGMHWEAGYAFAKGLPMLLYGEPTSIYDTIPQHADEMAGVLEFLEDVHHAI